MQRVHYSAIALIGGMIAATHVGAQDVSAFPPMEPIERPTGPASIFMRVHGPAQPPHGFVRFCESTPAECSPGRAGQEARFDATPARLQELDDMNRSINRSIQPATDVEVYGVNEYWTLPTKRGDCEDYALLKRHNLILKGWPISALLMTVVRDEKGEGHAVLTARTVQGDFILDNKTDQIRTWNKTPYEFVMRQSYLNPHVWVALESRDTAPATALTGLELDR